MKILKSDLNSAAQNGIITSDQSEKLWNYFEGLRPNQAKFNALYVLYYFGGVLILASMSWFLTKAWNDGGEIMMISALFGIIYFVVGNNLWAKENFKTPAGLLMTAFVGLVPVFIYGFQKMAGLWLQEIPGGYMDYHFLVKGEWIFMEIGTIVASLIVLRFYQFPFITFPLALSLWYMSMDIAPLFFGTGYLSYEERKIVSCIFGFVVLIISYLVDRKYKNIDYAFWTYLYGMLAFWIGLSLMNSQSELSKFIYCLLNIIFIITAVYLRRKVFMVFGVIGVLGYIGHLAWEVFKNSHAFPVVLSVLGILIIILGMKYQQNKDKFEAIITSWFPTFLMKWRPEERV